MGGSGGLARPGSQGRACKLGTVLHQELVADFSPRRQSNPFLTLYSLISLGGGEEGLGVPETERVRTQDLWAEGDLACDGSQARSSGGPSGTYRASLLAQQ